MKAKIIEVDKEYYICAKGEYPGNDQFVCGTTLGGRISVEPSFGDVLEVYFDFKFYEEGEDGIVVMKKYNNKAIFDDNDRIDTKKVDMNSMWNIKLENIYELENSKHQALIDILNKL